MPEEFNSVDKIEWSKGDLEFHQRIGNILPGNDEKCAMIMTLLGQAGMLADYVATTTKPTECPMDVLYAVTLTAANFISFLSDEPVKFKKMDERTSSLNEQTKEHIFRKMKHIIETLHADLQAIENELKLSEEK